MPTPTAPTAMSEEAIRKAAKEHSRADFAGTASEPYMVNVTAALLRRLLPLYLAEMERAGWKFVPVAVLKPFADEADNYDGTDKDSRKIDDLGVADINVGHLRAAKAALATCNDCLQVRADPTIEQSSMVRADRLRAEPAGVCVPVLAVGQEVCVTDDCEYPEWRGRNIWICGVTWDSDLKRLNYWVSENWPPNGRGDITDGWEAHELSAALQAREAGR